MTGKLTSNEASIKKENTIMAHVNERALRCIPVEHPPHVRYPHVQNRAHLFEERGRANNEFALVLIVFHAFMIKCVINA